MSGSGRVALSDIQECSEGPLGYPGVVGRLTRTSESGQVVLPDVREWSRDPHGCPAVLGRPSRMTGSCRESISEDREILYPDYSKIGIFE